MKGNANGRSEGAKQALLRGGAGKHADRRTKRLRTRSAQRTEAIRHG
jgi:hypothetical protein